MQHLARRLGLIGLIIVETSALHGQMVLTPECERLRRYEGTYEDEGGGTLQIVASPRDNILIAVLDGARYPLKAAGPDLLLNAGAPLDPARLSQMGEALVAGRYPEVHSVLIAHRGRYRLHRRTQ
jgi:hypothetical protein